MRMRAGGGRLLSRGVNCDRIEFVESRCLRSTSGACTTLQLNCRWESTTTEAYHRRINSICQCSHPTLWLFLQKLIDEENVVHVDLVQINAEEPPKMKKLNERLERCLTNLLNSSHNQLSVQLDSIAHNITL